MGEKRKDIEMAIKREIKENLLKPRATLVGQPSISPSYYEYLHISRDLVYFSKHTQLVSNRASDLYFHNREEAR